MYARWRAATPAGWGASGALVRDGRYLTVVLAGGVDADSRVTGANGSDLLVERDRRLVLLLNEVPSRTFACRGSSTCFAVSGHASTGAVLLDLTKHTDRKGW